MPRNFPTGFVAVSLLCFLSSTDWAGGIRVDVQNWVFDLIGSPGSTRSLARVIVPKIPHLALFGLLGYVAAREFRNGHLWWLFAASIAVAIVAEILQIFTSTRAFTVGDLAVNVVSVAALFWAAIYLRHRFRQTSNP